MLRQPKNGPKSLHHLMSNPGLLIIISLIAATNYSFTHRMAASMRKRIVQDFQMQLFKTCGIRSLVLTAYEGEDHDLNICLYAMHLYILIQS